MNTSTRGLIEKLPRAVEMSREYVPPRKKKVTPPKFKSLPLKNDGWKITLPETNIAPENGWLEYYFPIGKAHFQGLLLLVSGRVFSFWGPVTFQGRAVRIQVGMPVATTREDFLNFD